jgi:hypothetical protein
MFDIEDTHRQLGSSPYQSTLEVLDPAGATPVTGRCAFSGGCNAAFANEFAPTGFQPISPAASTSQIHHPNATPAK